MLDLASNVVHLLERFFCGVVRNRDSLRSVNELILGFTLFRQDERFQASNEAVQPAVLPFRFS